MALSIVQDTPCYFLKNDIDVPFFNIWTKEFMENLIKSEQNTLKKIEKTMVLSSGGPNSI